MKNRRNSEISESEGSEEEAQPSTSKNVTMNTTRNSGPESSSDSEDSTRPPSPPRRVSTPSPKKNVSSNPFEKFLAANRGLSKLAVDDVVSEDDEVCMLEVPTAIDPAHFMGKLINFNTKTKIKLDGSRYIVEPETENVKPISLLTGRLRVIRPVSVLKLRQYKKKKREGDVVSSEVSPPPVLPDNLKIRHPLFGAEYKRKIALSQEVQKKLEEAVDVTVRKLKKKKHKEVDDSHSFVTPVVPNDTGMKKKKKKKKHLEDNEAEHQEGKSDVDESIFALLETHIADKKKHRNHVKEDAMIEESREPLVNSDSGKKKKRKNSGKEEMFSQEGALSEPSVQLESRKRQNSVKREMVEARNSLPRFEDSDFETEKTRKHKKNNTREELLTEAESSFAYPSFDENKPKKKKKRDSSIKQERVTSPSTQDEPDCAPADEPIKRKRKNSRKEERFTQEGALSEPSVELESRKRQNSVKREMVEARNSLPRFEDSYFETEKTRKHKKNNTKEEFLTEAESSFAYPSFDENKPEKKKKRDSSIKQEIISRLDEPHYTPVNESKRKRQDSVRQELEKQNRFVANSTILPGLQLPCFEFDVSDIMNNEVHNDSTKNEDDNFESLTQEEHHKKKKKKKKEDTRENDEETLPRLDLKQEHHKKKSKKEKPSEETLATEGGTFEWMTLEQETLKKSKSENSFGLDVKMRKRKIKEECVTAGESCSEAESPKKKKRKHDGEEDVSSAKKKRKIKEEKKEADFATSSLISDLLNRVKTEMDGSTSHRKRKSEKF